MSSGSIRIIQLPEKSSVNTDDYMAVDSSANGTKKVKFTDLLDNNLSAQNKAADAQATGEAINDISARVDNMINTQTNAEVTTLWTGTLENKNQSVTLLESIANFDFIDIYGGDVDNFYIRKPVASIIRYEIQSQNMSDDASVQFLYWWETGLTISGTTATITKCIRCYWDDFSQAPVVLQVTKGINITRIDGIKIGHAENDEIVDARVGYDGTQYSTLGDAIRGQVTDLESDLEDNTGVQQISFIRNKIIRTDTTPVDLTPVTNTSGEYALVNCSEGDVFYITGRGFTAAYLYSFLDSDNNIISYMQGASGVNTGVKCIAPKNAVKAVFNNYYDGATSLLLKGEFLIETITSLKDNTRLNAFQFNPNDFVVGGINPVTGADSANSERLRTTDYISSAIMSISGTASHRVALYAYDANDSYVGVWNGQALTKPGNVPMLQSIDITAIPNYASYNYRITVKKTASETGGNVIPLITFNATLAYLQSLIVNEEEAENGLIYKSNDEQAVFTSSSDLFSAYDSLVANNPNYVTKNALTSGLFTNYEYVFDSGNYNEHHGQRDYDTVIAKPLVLIMAGVHGDEQSSLTSLYVFLKALCDNNPYIAHLRQMFTFKVIPLVCPWGLNNNKRWNSNGVNINRNFNANWVLQDEPYTNGYSGPSAASEDETKLVQNWIDSNSDAMFILDFHNSGYSNEVSYFSLSNTFESTPIYKKAYRLAIDDYIGYWMSERNMVSNSLVFGYTGYMNISGSTQAYGTQEGHPTITLETSWNQNSTGQNSNITIGIGAEVVASIISKIAQQFIEE